MGAHTCELYTVSDDHENLEHIAHIVVAASETSSRDSKWSAEEAQGFLEKAHIIEKKGTVTWPDYQTHGNRMMSCVGEGYGWKHSGSSAFHKGHHYPCGES